jgi:hypothetical protein
MRKHQGPSSPQKGWADDSGAAPTGRWLTVALAGWVIARIPEKRCCCRAQALARGGRGDPALRRSAARFRLLSCTHCAHFAVCCAMLATRTYQRTQWADPKAAGGPSPSGRSGWPFARSFGAGARGEKCPRPSSHSVTSDGAAVCLDEPRPVAGSVHWQNRRQRDGERASSSWLDPTGCLTGCQTLPGGSCKARFKSQSTHLDCGWLTG